MSAHFAPKASSVSASTTQAGGRTGTPAATNTTCGSGRHFRRSCASNATNGMSEGARRKLLDRAFFLVLTPLAAVSLPSLLFCLLEVALWIHGALAGRTAVFHLPAQSGWDHLFSLQSAVYMWVARWNALATLAATGLFVSTLLGHRWRHWTVFSLVPYALLLCADFTLRWRTVMLP